MDTLNEQLQGLASSITSSSNVDVFLPAVVINFFMCALMSFVLKYIYERSSVSLAGFAQISSVLPSLALIVFLVISIVKSSLALSLGLVGALSIVRFRTPIKEPQELVFVFASIAFGLGYGAGMLKITTMIGTLLFIYLYFIERNDVKNLPSGNQLKISLSSGCSSEALNEIKLILNSLGSKFKLIRLEDNLEVSFIYIQLDIKDQELAPQLLKEIKNINNVSEISLSQSMSTW